MDRSYMAIRRLVTGGALAFTLSATPTLSAQSPADGPELFRVDFQQIELTDLVRYFSAITGENFILVPDTLAGRTMTIISPRPVTAADARDLFLAAIEMSGLIAERREHFWLIRPQ
jgi:type II secretory pathway component GspD/PulD (secretin)